MRRSEGNNGESHVTIKEKEVIHAEATAVQSPEVSICQACPVTEIRCDEDARARVMGKRPDDVESGKLKDTGFFTLNESGNHQRMLSRSNII